ncbi:MAG: formate/nitrite transporter family protein [Lentisphaeria bacterium]
MKAYCTPRELVDYSVSACYVKSQKAWYLVLLSAILAGMFIAIGAAAANIASATFGGAAAKIVMAAVFPVGLMLTVMFGTDLFTSSCMLVFPVLNKELSIFEMFQNLSLVYIGNFIGAVFLAWSQVYTHQMDMFGGELAVHHVNIALHKLHGTFGSGVVLGILCNILVCGAVLLSYCAKDIPGKILGIFFPIFAFIISGYQHSVANMYYVPAAMFSKSHSAVQAKFSAEQLSDLSWGHFIVDNLVPVTIGNFIGGGILLAGALWYLHTHKESVKAKH